MKIKRTVKPEFDEAGKTEIIGDTRMENIIRQTRLGWLDPQRFGHEEGMRRLAEGQSLETFYATYEPVTNP